MHRPRPEQGRLFCPLLAVRETFVAISASAIASIFDVPRSSAASANNYVANSPFDFRSGQVVRFLDKGKRTAYCKKIFVRLNRFHVFTPAIATPPRPPGATLKVLNG